MRFSAMTRSVVSVSTCDFCVSSLRTAANSLKVPPSASRCTLSHGAKCCAGSKTILMVLKPDCRGNLYSVHQRGSLDRPVNMIASPAGNPRYLVSGASGMLGTALQQALAARRLPVLQLVRPGPPRRPRWFEPSRPIDAEPREPSDASANRPGVTGVAIPGQFSWNPAANPAIAHPEVLEGFTAAIHLSGASVAAHRWTAAYKRAMTASRVNSTLALSTTLARLRHPPQALLVASAVGFYGNRADELLDETSAPGSGFLAALCGRWEAAAQPAAAAGIRVVHLRFGVVLGPGPGALARMAPLFRLGLGGRLRPRPPMVERVRLPPPPPPLP